MSAASIEHYDVVIIGGGVVGCALARELSKYAGLRVVVVEMYAEIGFGTSKANSGIVHPGHHDKPGTVKASVVVRGNELIREFSKELGFGFRQCGEVMVAKNEEEFAALKAMVPQAEAQKVPVEIWDQERLRREEPNLSATLVGALYAPTAGVINPYELVHALMQVATDNGVTLKANSPVTSIVKQADPVKRMLVCTDKEKMTATFVVNAAGIWADKIANMVDLHTFTIKPRKGEEYLLDKSMASITSRIIFPVPSAVSKGVLIIPTVDHTLMVGPTAVDTEDRWDLSTTAEGCQTVFANVTQMCSTISERYVIASFAGLRAVSSTNDFIIGPTTVKGFINAAGIQSPGLTSAPAIAEKLVEVLRAEGLATIPKPDWKSTIAHLPKFFTMSPERQEAYSKEKPLFGRVVCRCELVTEGDIHEAIDHGACCLDGVKFRTRSGMGRCQGGFCTSRIVQILSQRLGIRLDEVTKRGSNTHVLHQAIAHMPELIGTAELPHVPFPQNLHVFDVAVIGGGPAGLAAGIGARQSGARDVVVFDREESAGGILNQCIHAGFGLHYFKEELTGPEYAQRFLIKALEEHVRICTSSFVMDVEELPGGNKKLRVLMANQGVKTVVCKSMVLAMGCRERSRAAIKIPGTRPVGIFTAGLAQRFVNMYGHLPGKKIVILGSGDIGLIMARRMTLEHCEVKGVFEIMPTCSGLNRNVVQCLHDYNIPLFLAHTVVKIHGKDRLEKVTVAPVDSRLRPIMEKAWDIECDCLLLSVGLIPENEISNQLRVRMNGKTNGPIVSSSLMTSMNGVFACGNVLHVHDLVDNVSREGLLAGKNAARWALTKDTIYMQPGENVAYVLPEMLSGANDQIVSLRVKQRISPAIVRIGSIMTKHLAVAAPSEMIRINVKKEKIVKFIENQLKSQGHSSDGTCTLAVDVLPDTSEGAEEERKAQEKAAKERAAADSAAATGGAAPQLKAGQCQSDILCLSCPHGCEMKVVSENKKVLSIVGASCSRGWTYAEQEVVDPRRFFSTTVPIAGAMTAKLPVKITKPLPKDKLVAAAKEIQKLSVKAPVQMGEVLMRDVMGEAGCDVISCRTLEVAEDEGKKYIADIEHVTRVSAPDVTVLYDTHDGHSEAAATTLAEELQARNYDHAFLSPEEMDLGNLATLRVIFLFVMSVPGESPLPKSFKPMAEVLEKAAPGSLNKVRYAVFGLSSEGGPKQPAATLLSDLLQRAGAINIFLPGHGGDLTSAGYLSAVENWMDAGLWAAIEPFAKPKVEGGASAEAPARRKTARPPMKIDGVEEEEKPEPLMNIEELPEHYCKSSAVGQYSIAASPDKWLNTVIAKSQLCKGIVEIRVICPTVAQFCEPGQFVMVCLDKKSERIPLTIADFSRTEGWITLVIQDVGFSSARLCEVVVGRRFRDIAGPLGHASITKDFNGPVVCVAGGVGVAPIFPVARGMKLAGNRVIGIIGARSKDLVIWEDKMRQYCDELYIATDDGSYGTKGFGSTVLEQVLAREKGAGHPVVRVVAFGPTIMMKACTNVCPPELPVIVSLPAVMVDGTGMCGCCRVTTAGKTAFVCVDGPEFEGHTIDWEVMLSRLQTYTTQERFAVEVHEKPATVPPVAHIVPPAECGRVPMPAQDAKYRAGNFDEVALGYTPQMALAEAARCKQCENATCRDGCPVGVDIKRFIWLVQQRRFGAAARCIKKYHACPAICGRVCPQETQCEAVCYTKVMEKKDSVAIGNLERFVADWEAAHPEDDDEDDGTGGKGGKEEEEEEEGEGEKQPANVGQISIADKRVAIIGAGPAGLICAAEVAKAGAKVTIYEALSAPGGVLIYGIPEFRLPKTIVDRETSYIRDDLGVEFRYNHPVGPAGSVPQMLKEGFSSIFIGTGAGLPWFLGIEGEQLKGVYSSNEFLTRVNLMKAYKFPAYPTPVLLGDSVAVVGGGNVAMDAARCAKRLGAKNVYIVYRRTRSEMPARLDEVHHALEEGIIFRELTNPTKLFGDKNGCVCAMELQIQALGEPDASGRRRPMPTDKFERVEIQQFVVAIGNGPNPMLTKSWPDLKTNKGLIVADSKTQATNIPGVFAGGDIVTGAATVIEAMGAGKRAAGSIIKYLQSL